MAGRRHGKDDRPDPEKEYARLAELAERIATDIAIARPDWCALARDAAELADGTRARCEQSSA